MPLHTFHDTYAGSREAFLVLARAKASKLDSHVLSGVLGAEGEVLAMDVATFGDPEAKKAFLILCGTHGLEGGPGSAVQRRFIDSAALPEGVKIVAVHALNPWGFSHGSRTDEANIDPNRNFVDFGVALQTSPAYEDLHAAQCPPVWTDTAAVQLQHAIVELAGKRGLPYVMEGLTVGQHLEPTGLNYGGQAPSWANGTIQTAAAQTLGDCEKIAYLEWHSGFGEYGELFHVCLHPQGSEALEQAAKWWGRAAVTRNGDAIQGSGGVAPNWRGLLMTALPHFVPNARVAGAVIEFGTFANTRVLEGLMIDRWLKFGTDNTSTMDRAALEQTKREIFYPTDPIWRDRVMEQALLAQQQALEGLAAW